MSSTVFTKQMSTPVPTRRQPRVNEDNAYNSQRSLNRRSLSGRFRSLFRKSSTSPNRTSYTDGRSPSTSTRQRSPSPVPIKPATEAPHLKAPTIYWPFGKKKSNLSTTTTNKSKTKGSRKIKRAPVPPLEISGPVYDQGYQTSIRGQNFVPRTPELVHGTTVRNQPSTNYETETKGFRDYMVIDHTKSQQVSVPDLDNFLPPTYTSDHSRSPSLNRRRLPDPNIEYSYHYVNSPSPLISDVEIITTPLSNTQILSEKNPIYSPSTIPHDLHYTSSSSLTNNELRSTVSSSRDIDLPKLHAPTVSFGSVSSERKIKPTGSQSRNDGTYSSSSFVNKLIQPNSSRPWTDTYGSLPDGEFVHNRSVNSVKSTARPSILKYPWLSAIVEQHMHPDTPYLNERPSTTISTHRPQMFETSTTTFDNYDQRQQLIKTSTNGSVSSPSSVHRHDGYIRPLTPPRPAVQQPDIGFIRVDYDSLRDKTRSPPPRLSYYNSSESPTTYRSSTTVYTKDKHHQVGGGELRTWSSQGNDNDINNIYKRPSPPIQIEHKRDQHIACQVVPPKIHTKYADDEQDEEKYEITYEYQPDYQHQTLYDTQKYLTNLYTNHVHSGNNSSTLSQSTILERDKIFGQPSRSYIHTERTQEPFNTIAPIKNSEGIPRQYSLKRSDSYDGLGILISADSRTPLNPHIYDVEPASPGYRAGLRKDDRIVGVNGVNVENVDFTDVLLLIKQGLNNNNLQFSVVNKPSLV